jgi:selenobiotic family peptide radical SAM maturase
LVICLTLLVSNWPSRAEAVEIPVEVDSLCLNPSVQLLHLKWNNLREFLSPAQGRAVSPPEPVNELVVAWKDPVTLKRHCRAATGKSAGTEDGGRRDESTSGCSRQRPISSVNAAIDAAVRDGILLASVSKIRREMRQYQTGDIYDPDFFSASIFTLQWHITQTCDLHCKHCYDRSERGALEFAKARKILDDLSRFCEMKHVQAQISFSGGNPLLYPHFRELYREASERGFALAILGNPAPREQIEALISIEKPVFFQVSLEGLEEHNDSIRGQDTSSGH